MHLSSCNVSRGIQEALTNLKWVQAIMEEIEALKNNNTWTLVPLPKEMNIVGCKWVFSIKYKANGSIKRSNTRLATKRYTHIYGVDYNKHSYQWQN